MKRLILWILVVLLLAGCQTTPTDPTLELSAQYPPKSLAMMQREIAAQNKLMGCAYLGWAEGNFKAVNKYLKTRKYLEAYPFIGDIDAAYFAQNEGAELYCVVPKDNTVTLSVYEAKLNEAYELVKGDMLLSVTDGEAVLLRGNVSDIYSNFMVVASDGNITQEYAPCRSGADGYLVNEGNQVLDFTPYYLMEEFDGIEKDIGTVLSGVWNAHVTDTNEREVDMELSFLDDHRLHYSYRINGGQLHWFKGEWDTITNGKLRLIMWGGPVDENGAFLQGETGEIDAYFAWETAENCLTLYYENGISLYPNALINTFPFTRVTE